MAFHALSSTIVLVGGAAVVGNRNETWFWDGTNWKQQSPVGHPGARSRAAEVYDAATRSIVLFGGCCDASNIAFADTWAMTIQFPNAFLPLVSDRFVRR
jgi:hypothetical protein